MRCGLDGVAVQALKLIVQANAEGIEEAVKRCIRPTLFSAVTTNQIGQTGAATQNSNFQVPAGNTPQSLGESV